MGIYERAVLAVSLVAVDCILQLDLELSRFAPHILNQSVFKGYIVVFLSLSGTTIPPASVRFVSIIFK